MSRFRVALSLTAEAQLDEITRWWRDNRGSSALLKRELHKARTLLVELPKAGAPADFVAMGVRQILLRRTQYILYYRLNEARREVLIVAIWHTARGSGPPL